MEDLDQEIKCTIIDNSSQKLLNSGYSLDQVRRTITNGIKGYGSRVARYQKMGPPIRRTGAASRQSRNCSASPLGTKTQLKKTSMKEEPSPRARKEPKVRTDIKSTLFVNYTAS